MVQRFILATWLILLLVVTDARGANWGHWRGEVGNGVSSDAQPPTEWSDSKNVKWKTAIPGRGSGSPVVWNDQVFVVTAVPINAGHDAGELRFEVRCLARATGRLLWSRAAIQTTPHQGTHTTNGYASASPCTDGVHVYAHFGSRGLYCYSMDGELVWTRDFGKMTTRSSFGEGSSPTLFENKIIVPWDHEGQSQLFVLNKLTGETIWQVERDEPSCWATPLVVEYAGGRQIVMNGQNFARAYDLQTGEELWRCAGQTQRPVASPVAGHGLIFVGSGFRGSFLAAFRPDGRGDVAGTDSVVWSISRDTPDIPSFLLSEDRLYFFKDKSGLLTCLDAVTGKPHYRTQRIGLQTIYASPISAGGHVYLTDRNGTTVVIDDAPKLKIVATNSLGETVDATPAPVDDQLFIRGETHLFCIESK